MTYRVGNHHGVTIVREGDGHRCDRPGHDCDRGHLVGVMLTAEDAALVVAVLNAMPGVGWFRTEADGNQWMHPGCVDVSRLGEYRGSSWVCGPTCPGVDAPSARVVSPQTAETGPVVPASTSDDSEAAETPPAACGRTNPHMPHAFGEMFDEECAGIPSPCACPPADGPRTMPDPLCPRHQRRKVRGPTFDERLDVRRRIDQQAEHRPSSLGDGLGYGPCVGCGELWPCTASRGERCTCPRHGAVM